MRRFRYTMIIAGMSVWVLMWGLIGGATAEADKQALDADNPLRPLPTIPLGVNKTFDQLDKPPIPQRVRLGRWLFFDKRLSIDSTVSCATCHRPEHGFSEPTSVSTGVNDMKGKRKAPPVLNLAWTVYPHFFWDGRAGSLEDQAVGPMINPVEMAMPDHDLVIERITAVKGYAKYFKQAFGDETVTLDRIAHAIADYERTLLSGNSPWDRWTADMTDHDRDQLAIAHDQDDDPYSDGEPDYPAFKDGQHVPAQVKLGHWLFHGKAMCNQCHLGFNFTDQQFHNLGVGYDAQTKQFNDVGRFDVTKNLEDTGAFKTPLLRDVSKHAPYMHDGSIPTLRQVVELYNRGGDKNPYLSPKIEPLNLTDSEIDALVAFMRALDGQGYDDPGPTVFPQ